MEYELTHGLTNTYPVTRRSTDFVRNPEAILMDDTIEQKEDSVPVGRPTEESEQAKKEKEEKEKQAKFVAVSKEQQDKARKAWEEWRKKIQEMGQAVPERHEEQVKEFIERGIEPRHIVSGASDGGPFANFDAEKYKANEGLYNLAKELQEAGRREEITDERIDDFKKRLDTMTQLGQISEDENRRFNSDINKAIVPVQEIDTAPTGESAVGMGIEAKGGVDLTGDMGFEQIRELIGDLSNPDMPQAETMDSLKQAARELVNPYYDKKEHQDKVKELTDILKSNNPEELARRLEPFLDAAVAKRKDNYSKGKVEIKGQDINSIQDLAKFIMNKQESALYGAFNKYALIDYVKDPATGETKEVFRPDNFLIWVRDQIIQLHDDNRTGEMQPLSAVAIETQLRTITIYMMQRFKGQYFRDEETNEIMTDLADTAVNMCYLFGFFRNMDLAYKQVMNSDEDLPKTIVGIHAKNDVTHGDNWAQFLSMPDRFGQAKKDPSGNVLRDEKGSIVYDRDTRVGDAELVANDIYYNLSDIGELRDIVGEKGSLMTKEGFKKTLLLQQMTAGQKHEWDGGPDGVEGFYDKEKDNFYLYNKDTGKKDYIFKGNSIDEKNYLTFVNFFNAPTPDKTQMDFVRDLIRLTIAEKAGLESGLARNEQELAERKARYEKRKAENGIDDAEMDYKRHVKAAQINTKFAEYSSFVQQRPLMVAARNDINRRGYDASTKLDLNYIVRQSGAGTAGPIGSTEFLKHQIIKNFGVDFVAGLKTESKRSPYEIFREIRKAMNDTSLSHDQREDKKAALLAELRFQDNAALDYSSNAIKRAYDIFHQVVDAQGLDLNKIVSKNFLEGIKYNTAEFEKQIKDDFIKPMRYAFSSNSALKYGQMYRGFEQLKDNMPVYKWKTLADHMFGDEVLDDIKKDALKNRLKIDKYDDEGHKIPPSKMSHMQRYQEYLNSSDGRTRIVKNITRARLAAELRKHRNRWGPAERWSADMVNKFLLSLETIKEFKKDEKGNIVETGDRFFSDGDIAWIRQHSKTGYKRMMAEEATKDLLSGSIKGAYEGLKEIFEYTFK